jgi:hypothetical protein
MVVMLSMENGKFVEVARTEVIWDNPNPNFVKVLKAMYIFETNQPLRFAVYDCDSEEADLKKHDFIGYCDTNVQTLVSNFGKQLTYHLKLNDNSNDNRGDLIIVPEETVKSGSHAVFNISVRDLKKMRTFSRNWPYLVISKVSESGLQLPVFRSEVVKKCSACTFKKFEIPMAALCNGDMSLPLTFTIYDFVENKVDKVIGSVEFSVGQALEGQGTERQLTSPKNKKAGFLKLNSVQIVQKPTFVDYLRGGLQLNLVTAIDFTSSNGNVNDPRSLHYLNPNAPNQYESCIWAVGGVVCPYDSDQLFPVYGFGGRINGGPVNHCFPLTFNPQDPNVNGLNNIVGCYRNSLMHVQLYGPTCFAPIIRASTDVARVSFQQSKTYTILMILTDGIINDVENTIDAIVDATDAPLSIIIIGVGTADFTTMDVLDADEKPLRSSAGVLMKRDIVQFVPFRDFANKSPQALAAEVLEEVPRQVDEFCRSHGFIPPMNN